jgi:hypothetical protein
MPPSPVSELKDLVICWKLMGLPGQLTEFHGCIATNLVVCGADAFFSYCNGLTVVVSGTKVACVRARGDKAARDEETKLMGEPVLASHTFFSELVDVGVPRALVVAYAIVTLRTDGLLRSTAMELLSQPVRDAACYTLRCMSAWMRLRHASIASLHPIERFKAINFCRNQIM